MWVLIIIALGGTTSTTSPALDHIDFYDRVSCEAAKLEVEQGAKRAVVAVESQGYALSAIVGFSAMCVQK